MIARRRWTGSYHQRTKNGRRDPAAAEGGEVGVDEAI
jgi:hypothetical protein